VQLGTFTKKVKRRKEIVGAVLQNCIISQKTSKPTFTNENTSFHSGHSLLENNNPPFSSTLKKRIYRFPKRKPPSSNSVNS